MKTIHYTIKGEGNSRFCATKCKHVNAGVGSVYCAKTCGHCVSRDREKRIVVCDYKND